MYGKKFGRLKVIRATSKIGYYLCVCDCGKVKRVRRDHLKTGKTQSCGCLRRKVVSMANTKHGMYGTKEYRSWLNIKDRCNNPNHSNYPHYGGRGIAIDPDWNKSFQAFYDHVGDAPSPKHTIDRIDNDGNYEPGNVRWATLSEQQMNRTDTEYIKIGGYRMTPRQWCELAGHKHSTYMSRVKREWDKVEAIVTPPVPPKQRREARSADAQRLWLDKVLELAIGFELAEVDD